MVIASPVRGLLHVDRLGHRSASTSHKSSTATVPTHERRARDEALWETSLQLEDFLPPDRAPDYADVTYKEMGGNKLRLDIYLPETQQEHTSGIPAVFFIHGGAWRNGSKSYLWHQGRKLVSESFAVVAIDYRLTSEVGKWGDAPVTWPAQGEDVADAVRWLRKHSSLYGIDPQRLGCWGESAGGQLCTWLATQGAMSSETRLAVAVSMFGVTCFLCEPYTDEYFTPDWLFDFPSGTLARLKNAKLEELIGSPLEAQQIELVHSAEATYNLGAFNNSQATPTFIAHGKLDEIVPPKCAKILASELSKVGVDHRLVMVENGGHTYSNWSGEPLDAAISFINEHFRLSTNASTSVPPTSTPQSASTSVPPTSTSVPALPSLLISCVAIFIALVLSFACCVALLRCVA